MDAEGRESFSVDVAFELERRSATALGSIGGRTLRLAIDDPLVRPLGITGEFGSQPLQVRQGWRDQSFTGEWGTNTVTLAMPYEDSRFLVTGEIGGRSIRVHLRKETFGDFVLEDPSGEMGELQFGPENHTALTGRVLQPIDALAVALVVVPAIRVAAMQRMSDTTKGMSEFGS